MNLSAAPARCVTLVDLRFTANSFKDGPPGPYGSGLNEIRVYGNAVSPIPEPSTTSLFAVGALLLTQYLRARPRHTASRRIRPSRSTSAA